MKGNNPYPLPGKSPHEPGRGPHHGPHQGPHAALPDDEWRRAQEIIDRSERTGRRILYVVLGCIALSGVLLAAFVLVLMLWADDKEPAAKKRDRTAFTVNTFYPDGERFTARINQTVETYTRLNARDLPDAAGCQAGAADAATRELLTRLKCDGRVEIALRTGANVLVSSHVLRFPDENAAKQAAAAMKYTGLRFTAGGPFKPRGGATYGDVTARGRHIAVTASSSKPQADIQRKTRRGAAMIHAETSNVLLWTDD
ncbi:hypothetical protein GCM10009678_42400 [Actinomadura kijaniata]|uniref:Uncharacterized protein n=1 Tax=Actinomadura namibiensis TaxID=182080 RepID=A0A7W3LMH0_ACTNM|nr:hypothetical protein [Actinomadura namibiensis]MBA8950812.1 hypothetical protein [Actinomadura namibiensis]